MKTNLKKIIAVLLLALMAVSSVCAKSKKKKADKNKTATVSEENLEGLSQQDISQTQADATLDQWPLVTDPEKEAFLGYRPEMPEGEAVGFQEVWAYVMDSRRDEYKEDMPVTDLCVFGATIGQYGEVVSIPNADNYKNFKGRKHMVVTCDGRSLSHFVLDPQYSVRNEILRTLTKVSKNFDGVQIDFENVPAKDAKHFRTFLLDLRGRMGKSKWMTVALPARIKDFASDIYPYKEIHPCVDRIIVMAYDEHWSTSKPGPIASMEWCEKVADYAVSVIPNRKLVMGLPFYGRTWQDNRIHQAWYYTGINRIMNENNAHVVERDNTVPYFTFKTESTVTGYFEDTLSLVTRMRMYSGKGVTRVGFWRIGQEDPEFWKWLKIEKK